MHEDLLLECLALSPALNKLRKESDLTSEIGYIPLVTNQTLYSFITLNFDSYPYVTSTILPLCHFKDVLKLLSVSTLKKIKILNDVTFKITNRPWSVNVYIYLIFFVVNTTHSHSPKSFLCCSTAGEGVLLTANEH